MFKSEIRSQETVITDDTDVKPLFRFNKRGHRRRDFSKQPYGSIPYMSKFSMPLIPRDEWDERIRDMEKSKSRLSDLLIGLDVLNQSNTSFCWANAPVFATMAIRRVAGQPDVRLSPASVACPINGFRNQGGWGSDALEHIIKYGIVPQSMWPANAIDRKYYTAEAKQEALKYRVTEWEDMESRSLDQLFTCLLSRIPVPCGYNWMRHEMTACDAMIMGPNQYSVRVANSWGGADKPDRGYMVLSGSKMYGDDQCCPRVAMV